ncbi:MAG TPA: hypothetical protein VHC49_08010 [Mycobacteriales bacterium]|nr:hypothetical protein [Mycobacteriales bacterium]
MVTRMLVGGAALIVLGLFHVIGNGPWLAIVGGVLVVVGGLNAFRRGSARSAR